MSSNRRIPTVSHVELLGEMATLCIDDMTATDDGNTAMLRESRYTSWTFLTQETGFVLTRRMSKDTFLLEGSRKLYYS